MALKINSETVSSGGGLKRLEEIHFTIKKKDRENIKLFSNSKLVKEGVFKVNTSFEPKQSSSSRVFLNTSVNSGANKFKQMHAVLCSDKIVLLKKDKKAKGNEQYDLVNSISFNHTSFTKEEGLQQNCKGLFYYSLGIYSKKRQCILLEKCKNGHRGSFFG